MEQNTNEWLEWRSKGIGASDTPIILGKSPWATPYQLWEQKLGLVENNFSNYATARGHALEDIARQHHELETGIRTKPKLVVANGLPHIRASLDGWNEEKRLVLEIKCPGEEDHKSAKDGKVPEKYFWQVQHQLLASNGNIGHYYSFDGENGVLLTVPRDEKAIIKVIEETTKFWNLIQRKEPPEFSDRDYKVSVDKNLSALISEYGHIDEAIKELENKKKNLRGDIIAISEAIHPRVRCNGFTICKAYRRGSVQYKKIPELEGVNTDQYRKDGFFVTTIQAEKGK